MDNITAIVEYDYVAKELDELDLRKGDIIHHIKQMEGGWWQGTMKTSGLMGMFPDNFVRVIDAMPPASNGTANSSEDANTVQLRDKTATTNRRCKVIYSYTQVNDDELTLAVGDVIEFLGEVEEGWWRGRLKTKVGVFPSNFVERIEPSPILAKKRPPSTQVQAAAAAAAAAAATTKATTTKLATTTTTTTTKQQTNRHSFHSSKEDLLSVNTTTTSTSSSPSPAAAAAAALLEDGAPTLPPKPMREFCRVEFPYAPQNDDELELKVGDIITVISTELADKGWWKGELRGKVGVFPDNFVKLLPPTEARRGLLAMDRGSSSGSGGGSFEFFGARMANFINTILAPLNEAQPQQAQRTAKPNNTVANATANVVASAANTVTHLTTNTSNNSSSTSTKVVIKKSGSTSSTQSSHRKDSFGSRDSLNDILSETGLQSGNVAAQRKSLENKNFDLTNAVDPTARLALKKQQQQQTITTTTTSSMSSNASAGNELRKSLETLDEKAKSPPPVLTKKPTVPTKKSTSVTSVAGNLLSGFKQKVRGVDNKLTTAASHDAADGLGSSKLSPGSLPEAAPAGNVVMRRAATIAVEDTEFDRVERASILPDMRAGRVKAPKRRPPSAAINVLGESNNNSVYVNGSGMAGSASELSASEDGGSGSGGKPQSSDDNSTGEEQLAKPKPREWEKKKAPWMEELKASQVKKKTSPNTSVAERTSKLFTEDKQQNNTAATSSVITSAASSTTSVASTTKVQSSAVTSTNIMQQSSMSVESSHKREINSSSSSSHSHTTTTTTAAVATSSELMSKSMSAKVVTNNDNDDARATRPNSLAIRHRSISPMVRSANPSSSAVSTEAASTTNTAHNNSTSQATATSNNVGGNTAATTAPATTKPSLLNNHNASGDSTRVLELERRVDKLESVVHTQQRMIDDLVRLLREETDRVKVLRGELDKYAQCVTQV